MAPSLSSFLTHSRLLARRVPNVLNVLNVPNVHDVPNVPVVHNVLDVPDVHNVSDVRDVPVVLDVLGALIASIWLIIAVFCYIPIIFFF